MTAGICPSNCAPSEYGALNDDAGVAVGLGQDAALQFSGLWDQEQVVQA